MFSTQRVNAVTVCQPNSVVFRPSRLFYELLPHYREGHQTEMKTWCAVYVPINTSGGHYSLFKFKSVYSMFKHLQSIQNAACAFWRELADATTSHQFFVAALASDEAAGRLYAGHSRLQVAARSSSIVSGWRLPADYELQTPPALLRSRQRPHCSENKHSTRRSRVQIGRASCRERV